MKRSTKAATWAPQRMGVGGWDGQDVTAWGAVGAWGREWGSGWGWQAGAQLIAQGQIPMVEPRTAR